MKIIHTSTSTSNFRKIIVAEGPGTTYYKATIDDIVNAVQEDSNLFVYYAMLALGFEAIDLEHNLFGSYIDGNTIYFCDTDGEDIEVNGQMFNPEDAMEEFGPEVLESYIQDATPEIIRRFITPYELKFDVDEGAYWLMKDGFGFTEIVKSYEDLPDSYQR